MKISISKKNKQTGVINVEVEKNDYETKVNDILKRYTKTAKIPGFRKGHIPMGLVRKQYGSAVKVDEINKLLDSELKKYIQEEKLDILGGPIPSYEAIDWDLDTINFDFEIGYTPEIKLNFKPKKPIIRYEVKADKKSVENQIKNIQDQYGKLISKSKIEKDFEITANFNSESDEINNSSMFKTDSLKPTFLKKIIGLKVGDSISEKTSKIFKEDYELSRNLKIDLNKAKEINLAVELKIQEINKREPADLDQELFDKVYGKNSIKSVTELKDKLSDDFVKQFQNQTDQKLMNDSIEYLIDSTKIKLPSEFLVKWMQLSSEKKISQNEAQTEYEKSEKGMKYQLIESKIIIDNKLQVNFEDLKSFTSELIKNQMLQYGQPIPEEKELDGIVARVMSNKDEIKRLTEQLTSNRILEFFKENFNYKLKKVSYDEYVKEVYPS
ncbi:MAG: trigger factor [Flavobacteriaceae bacterium]|nr:trigger factor [Flavobacteriaceae bacterium]|tara:strand:+ start:10152 stop:11471 length:1320 start_codon:yes stop_codon:yes gene_type:complete